MVKVLIIYFLRNTLNCAVFLTLICSVKKKRIVKVPNEFDKYAKSTFFQTELNYFAGIFKNLPILKKPLLYWSGQNYLPFAWITACNKVSQDQTLKICWLAVTRLRLQETYGSIFFWCSLLISDAQSQIYYPSLAYPGEQSKFLAFSSASFFSSSCCFDFSYPLPSTQVSLDCTTLDCQINQWKASTKAIRNTNDKENFQIRIEL